MISFDFGEVVLVPFPFTNQTRSKQRPAVVVSSSAYHAAKPDLIIMALTSQAHQQVSSMEAFVSDWQGAGLIKPSVIKPVVVTIERGMVIKKLGKFGQVDRAATRKILDEILGS